MKAAFINEQFSGKLLATRQVCRLLLLLISVSLLQLSAESQVITQINRLSLPQIAGISGNPTVDKYGLSFRVVKPKGKLGLFREFHIGVFPTVEKAERAVTELSAQQKGAAEKLEATGDQARAWKAQDNFGITPRYLVLMRRTNVVVWFQWQGTLEEATDYVRGLDVALQKDEKFAPRGTTTTQPLVEVVAPVVVAPAEPFDIFYRSHFAGQLSFQPLLIALLLEAQDDAEQQESQPVALTPTPLMAERGVTQGVLSKAGKHKLTLTFTTYGGVVLNRSIETQVLNSAEAKLLQNGKEWVLPQKAVYFTSAAGKSWADSPKTEREQIRLEHPLLTPLKGTDAEWMRLQVWNEMAQSLKTQWLPPRALIQVFSNRAKSEPQPVAYVAFQNGEDRLLYMSEVSQQAWLYGEQQAKADKTLQMSEILRPDLMATRTLAESELIFPQASFLSKSVERFRALSPEDQPESVRILMLHIGNFNGLHLRPNYEN